MLQKNNNLFKVKLKEVLGEELPIVKREYPTRKLEKIVG